MRRGSPRDRCPTRCSGSTPRRRLHEAARFVGAQAEVGDGDNVDVRAAHCDRGDPRPGRARRAEGDLGGSPADLDDADVLARRTQRACAGIGIEPGQQCFLCVGQDPVGAQREAGGLDGGAGACEDVAHGHGIVELEAPHACRREEGHRHIGDGDALAVEVSPQLIEERLHRVRPRSLGVGREGRQPGGVLGRAVDLGHCDAGALLEQRKPCAAAARVDHRDVRRRWSRCRGRDAHQTEREDEQCREQDAGSGHAESVRRPIKRRAGVRRTRREFGRA